MRRLLALPRSLPQHHSGITLQDEQYYGTLAFASRDLEARRAQAPTFSCQHPSYAVIHVARRDEGKPLILQLDLDVLFLEPVFDGKHHKVHHSSPSSRNSISSSPGSFSVCVFPSRVETGNGIAIRSSYGESFFPWPWRSMTCSSSSSASDKINL